MSEPFENLYFNWLYTKVCDIDARTPSLQFNNLLTELHQCEFVWLVLGDDNRAEDGCDLRTEFIHESGLEYDNGWYSQPCSVLEMLIAFSRRASFETDEPARDWFWIMLDNLGLSEFSNASHFNQSLVHDILNRFIWRTYDRKGDGGLFPMVNTRNDQTKSEIWYQFSEYVYEHNLA